MITLHTIYYYPIIARGSSLLQVHNLNDVLEHRQQRAGHFQIPEVNTQVPTAKLSPRAQPSDWDAPGCSLVEFTKIH